MDIKKLTLNLIITSSLITGYSICSSNVTAHREGMIAENLRAEALMISPTLLKVISGEFKGLWADYLQLKASIFLGGYYESKPEDWEVIYLIFKQSLALDPYFFQICYYTQGILAWREGMHKKAIDLLKVSAEHRYWDWEPRFFIGFDYYYFLKNEIEAARYMGEASKLPGSPPIVATLGARLAQRAGHTETAIEILHFMYDRARDEGLRRILENRIKAHHGMLVLERSIEMYEKRHGKRPPSLNELVDSGIIDQLPKNPFVKSYSYENGRLGMGF